MGESSTLNYSLAKKKKKKKCGTNCCVPMCTTNNARCRGLSFMRLPRLGVSVEQDEWRRRLQHAISRCDASFNPGKATICSRHFEEGCIKHGPSGKCTGLVFGSMPTRWMPPKSVVTPKTTRPEPKFREPPVVPERVCYTSLIDVFKDLAKIPAMWVILRKSEVVLDLGLVSDSSGDVQVKVSLSAVTDLQARVYVLQMPAPHLSRDLQRTRLPVFLQELSQKRLCTGITETELQCLAELDITSCQYFRHITYVLSDSKLKTASCVRSTTCLLLLEGQEAVCTMCFQAKQRIEKQKIKHEVRLQNTLKQNDSLRGLSVEDFKELFKQERKEKLKLEAQLSKFKNQLQNNYIELDPTMSV